MGFETEMMMFFKVALGALLGGIIGIEREVADKPAGFRTNMIIAGAAAFMIVLGESLVVYFHKIPEVQNITDPTRIIEAIIVGISFIGAGTIIQVEERHRVRYLTTAATVLFSASVGIAVALENYWLSVGSTFLILLINGIMNWVEKKFSKKDKSNR